MPRPRKIAQEESNISDVIEIQEELVIESEEELVIEPVSMTVPELEIFTVEEVVEEVVEEPILTEPTLEEMIADGYNPDARDGDGDGLVQDGTEWERPIDTNINPVDFIIN